MSEVQYFVQQGSQTTPASTNPSTSVPVTQVQGAAQVAAVQQSEAQAATLPVMINNADGQVQQANVQ